MMTLNNEKISRKNAKDALKFRRLYMNISIRHII